MFVCCNKHPNKMFWVFDNWVKGKTNKQTNKQINKNLHFEKKMEMRIDYIIFYSIFFHLSEEGLFRYNENHWFFNIIFTGSITDLAEVLLIFPLYLYIPFTHWVYCRQWWGRTLFWTPCSMREVENRHESWIPLCCSSNRKSGPAWSFSSICDTHRKKANWRSSSSSVDFFPARLFFLPVTS